MRGYTPEFLARLRHDVETSQRPLRLIATDYKIAERTLYRIAARERWVRAPRDLPPAFHALDEMRGMLAAQPKSGGETGPSTHADLSPQPASAQETRPCSGEPPPAAKTSTDRIAQLVEKELAAAEVMRAQLRAGPCAAIDVERIARTLSTLTQTLQTLQRLRAGEMTKTNDDDDFPNDINEFRHELARRIDAFVASRTHPADYERDIRREAVDAAGA